MNFLCYVSIKDEAKSKHLVVIRITKIIFKKIDTVQ